MKEFIKNRLVEMYKTCTTDKYGQVCRSNFTPSIFGDSRDDVEQYCKVNKGILQYNTYSAPYGTYRAFTIEDKRILKECRDVLSNNPNYIHNMTSW